MEFSLGGYPAMIHRLSEQFSYGHVTPLLDYTGLDEHWLIWGRLAHGEWGIPVPKMGGGAFLGPFGKELQTVTWSREFLEHHRNLGARKVVAVGSPWLYAMHNRGITPAWVEQTQPGHTVRAARTLYAPVHSWEHGVVSLRAVADLLARHRSPANTDVLLAWSDFLDPKSRGAFESRGFRVRCAGYRGSVMVPPSPIGGSREFLYALLDILLDYEEVFSDYVCTVLLYAGATGRRVFVDHDFRETAIRELSNGEGIALRDDGLMDSMNYYTQTHPLIADRDAPSSEVAMAIAEALGAPNMLSRQELRSRIDWRRRQDVTFS